jgi:hypothetical protein
MPKRTISLTDAKKRDAHVEIETPKRKESYEWISPEGEKVHSERFIKQTENHVFDALLEEHDEDAEALARALIEDDPEIDYEMAGRRVGTADRVYVRPDGSVIYCARTLLVQYDPFGDEVDRKDFIDVEATVSEEKPLPWTGRLFPVDTVVRKFAIGRKLRVRHVNGLTFDFLYDIAKHLDEEGKMLFVGAGKKGAQPLIFQTNGSPYRGFLEGRVDGDGYLLVLHLSNLELKRIPEKEAEE